VDILEVQTNITVKVGAKDFEKMARNSACAGKIWQRKIQSYNLPNIGYKWAPPFVSLISLAWEDHLCCLEMNGIRRATQAVYAVGNPFLVLNTVRLRPVLFKFMNKGSLIHSVTGIIVFKCGCSESWNTYHDFVLAKIVYFSINSVSSLSYSEPPSCYLAPVLRRKPELF